MLQETFIVKHTVTLDSAGEVQNFTELLRDETVEESLEVELTNAKGSSVRLSSVTELNIKISCDGPQCVDICINLFLKLPMILIA